MDHELVEWRACRSRDPKTHAEHGHPRNFRILSGNVLSLTDRLQSVGPTALPVLRTGWTRESRGGHRAKGVGDLEVLVPFRKRGYSESDTLECGAPHRFGFDPGVKRAPRGNEIMKTWTYPLRLFNSPKSMDQRSITFTPSKPKSGAARRKCRSFE